MVELSGDCCSVDDAYGGGLDILAVEETEMAGEIKEERDGGDVFRIDRLCLSQNREGHL